MPSRISRLLAVILVALLVPGVAWAASSHSPARHADGRIARKHHHKHRKHHRKHHKHAKHAKHGTRGAAADQLAHATAAGHGNSTGKAGKHTTASTTATTASTTASGPVPTHVPTWAYDDGCNGGTGATPSLVDSWVSYAESNCGPTDTKALSDCEQNATSYCTPVQYLDTNWIYQQGSAPIAQDAQESWWLHQPGYSDAAHRITVSGYGGGNLLNQANPAVDAWFRNYAQTNYNSYPALMMDDSSSSLSSALYGTGLTKTQEITSDSQLQAAHEQMAAAMTHSDGTPFLQIDNALSPNDNLTPPFKQLNDTTGTQGLIAEGAPYDNGQITSYYSTLLDELAYIDHTKNDFITLLSYDQNGSEQGRMVQAATELLGYNANHVVSWSDLEQNSNDLAVWPEQGIVPTNPIQTMNQPGGSGCLTGHGTVCSSGGHNDLQVAPGIYRREFGQCYDQGTPFGACATIINTTSAPVTIQNNWLTQTYSHQITTNGGDIQTGGTINTTGAPYTPNTTTIPADNATLLSN
jgi:hypothetical protein